MQLYEIRKSLDCCYISFNTFCGVKNGSHLLKDSVTLPMVATNRAV